MTRLIYSAVMVGILINPAAIPSGVTVDIGVEDFGTGHGYLVDEIVKDGAPADLPPDPPGQGQAARYHLRRLTARGTRCRY